MNDRLLDCMGCSYLCYDKELGEFKCLEAMGDKYNKSNCQYYEDAVSKFYEKHILRDDLKEFKGLDEYDFYMLVKPVADMILYNWGLKLVGTNDEYNLVVFNTDWFQGKLIKTLLTHKMI